MLGGLLIPHRLARPFWVKLEGRVRRFARGVAWPPHASRLEIPASRIEAVFRGADHCTPLAVALAERADRSDDPDVRQWRASWEASGRREADERDLRRLDGWLRRHHPAGWQGLLAEAREVEQGMLDVPATVSGAIAVASVDLPRREAEVDREGRYLRALTGLLHRVALLLDPHDDLLVRPAAFDRSFDSQLLNGLRKRLPAVLRDRIRILVDRPRLYQEGVSVGIVIADLVVNRLRRNLRGTWQQVARRVDAVLQLPVERNGAPAIAVEGPPRAAIDAVLARRDPPRLDPRALPPWAIEQARTWMRLLEAGR